MRNLIFILVGVSLGTAAYADINICEHRGDCPGSGQVVATIGDIGKLRGDRPGSGLTPPAVGNLCNLRQDCPGSSAKTSTQSKKTGSSGLGAHLGEERGDRPGSTSSAQ